MDQLTGETDVQKTEVDSSTTSTVNNEQDTDQAKSADSLNTDDKRPENVPYNRFKEVNDKFRNTEKELNEYKEKMKYWDKFSQVVDTNPAFSDKLNGLITDLNDGKLTKAEEKQVEKMIENETQSIKDPRVDELLHKYKKDTFNRYDTDFRMMAKNDFEDGEDISMVGKILTDLINKEHPNALDQYNPELISKYYSKAKDKVDALIKRQMGKYIKDKASDNIPSNKPSSPPSNNVDLVNAPREVRASHLAERLKQFKE
jgi:hypothetical protein